MYHVDCIAILNCRHNYIYNYAYIILTSFLFCIKTRSYGSIFVDSLFLSALHAAISIWIRRNKKKKEYAAAVLLEAGEQERASVFHVMAVSENS